MVDTSPHTVPFSVTMDGSAQPVIHLKSGHGITTLTPPSSSATASRASSSSSSNTPPPKAQRHGATHDTHAHLSHGGSALLRADVTDTHAHLSHGGSALLRADVTDTLVTRTQVVRDEFKAGMDFLTQCGLRGTFLFFGSARTVSREQFDTQRRALEMELTHAETGKKGGSADTNTAATLREQLERLLRLEWACEYWAKGQQLAALLTQWAKTEEGRDVGSRCVSQVRQRTEHVLTLPNGVIETPLCDTTTPPHSQCPHPASPPPQHQLDTATQRVLEQQPLVVCSGGGGGFMAAANAGAFAHGASMGVGIKLPFESALNPYLTPHMAMTATHFFVRKYIEVFAAKALIALPGGFGTLEEVFEVLTLIQCRQMPSIPVVLLGRTFWTSALNLSYVADHGMMSYKDLEALYVTDDVNEAFKYIRRTLCREVGIETEGNACASNSALKQGICSWSQASAAACNAAPHIPRTNNATPAATTAKRPRGRDHHTTPQEPKGLQKKATKATMQQRRRVQAKRTSSAQKKK